MTVFEEIYQALQNGNIKMVEKKTIQAIEEGKEPSDILKNALISAMDEIGIRFKNGEIFLPEVMMSAKAMQIAMNCLKPKLIETGVKPLGKAIIGTVKGDQHDIGKNLMGMMLMGAGIEVIDLGIDVPVERFISAIKEHNPDIVALSALLTTTMPQQRMFIEEITKQGLRDKVKIMVGGAPVSESFAKEIGADAYSPDAGSAAMKAKELING